MKSIYLDNHATTCVAPEVVEAMLPWLGQWYANPGSTTHEAGRKADLEIGEKVESIAKFFGAESDEVVITSGATESNNLALLGVALHPRQKHRKIISVGTEHQATLGPLSKLKGLGFDVQFAPVQQQAVGASSDGQIAKKIGLVDLDWLEENIDESVAIVSIMLANNEIGVLQPISEIARMCMKHGVVLHTDATQAVGRVCVEADHLGCQLISFSAHKIYGPKGVGGLVVRDGSAPLRLSPQIVGGGQQQNLRSGTLNTTGIVGLAAALSLASERRKDDVVHAWELREQLWQRLQTAIPGIELNGPLWDKTLQFGSDQWPVGSNRLVNNLNVRLPRVDGQSLMLEVPQVAVSSGSACTSAHPEPSHVLQGIGLTEDQARCSIRFGVGRYNTAEEIENAVTLLANAYQKLVSFVA